MPRRPLPVFALLALLPACNGDGTGATGETPPPAKLGYYEDIKPIVDAKCVGCHVDGGIAPFSLTTFDAVSAAQGSVKAEVASRRMPPWLAAPGCNEYADD